MEILQALRWCADINVSEGSKVYVTGSTHQDGYTFSYGLSFIKNDLSLNPNSSHYFIKSVRSLEDGEYGNWRPDSKAPSVHKIEKVLSRKEFNRMTDSEFIEIISEIVTQINLESFVRF